MVYRIGGTLFLEAARTRRGRGGRRAGDPGRPGRSVIRTLDRPDGSRSGDAGGRHDIATMSSTDDRPGPRPAKRQRASPRRRGAAAPAACSRTSSSTSASSTAGRWTTRSTRAHARTARRPSACCVTRRHAHRRPARARGRRALRPRPRRPRALPRRPRRRQARRARRRQALPGRAGLLRRRPHAAGRHGRPRQRARDRRHRGHDRLRGAPRGRVARPTSSGCSSASRTPTSATARSRSTTRRTARSPSRRRPGRRRAGADVRHPRENAPINFGAARRGRVGHPARAPRDQGGRRARRLRHPLRAAATSDMRVRYRIDGVLQEAATVPASAVPAVVSRVKILSDLDIAERRIPQDGRISLEVDEQADRPPRRDAARRLRREGRHANPRPAQGHDRARAARHAAAGARALHQGVRAGARRRARHRPDRLRQVDLALRRAEPAQHDREEHHHDRGPGRVPARRASRRSRSTTRRA